MNIPLISETQDDLMISNQQTPVPIETSQKSIQIRII